MNSTGIFTIHQFEIPFTKFDEPIYLLPFGDIHRHSPMCHEEKWLEFIDWARRKKRCYFLGMGDYDDLISASERSIFDNHSIHDSTNQTLESIYKKYTDKLAKEIGFMNGSLIGLLEGNHYVEFANGTTSTQRLCEALDTKYLGVSSFIRLSFTCKGGHHYQHCVDIWAHHGIGAARLVGGSMNSIERMAGSAEADIFLMGHDHKKSVGTMDRLTLQGTNGLGLSHRKILMVRTGSFLRGYVNNQKSYVADACMGPTQLGVVKIEMTPKRTQANSTDKEWIDLHASV